MTAIAYKNGYLVADSQISEDEYRFATMDKVRELRLESGVWFIAMSGEVGNFTKMANFLEDYITQSKDIGLRGAALTEEEFTRRVSREYDVKTSGDSGSIIVVKPSGDYSLFYAKHGFDGNYKMDTRCSIGVVWQYLNGAMDGGVDSYGAVKLACRQHGSCGPPVRIYKAGFGEIHDATLS